MSTLTTNDIEIATRAADNFTRLYYTTYDSATRVEDLPNFYRPTSALTWNGKPFEGVDGVRNLVAGIPSTKHEVQSFDCHPIPDVHARPGPERAPREGGEVAKYYITADALRFVG
ncbi:NTF2-like protein [Epithele typhae]|uniref:NTF2-like protein n=1 Tax=Epithele typhae TaxID=378194 RepID=UPI00200727CC|nr:NTF2-like protein [Epithele typhae]KAH9932075.1 NTF2-like protein [Epithele typhae]